MRANSNDKFPRKARLNHEMPIAFFFFLATLLAIPFMSRCSSRSVRSFF